MTYEIKLSKIFHDLNTIYTTNQTAKQREKIIGITVSETGRATVVPPLVAPFDFGIDPEWFQRESGVFAKIVRDWGKHGNPDGFDATDEDLEELEYDDANMTQAGGGAGRSMAS